MDALSVEVLWPIHLLGSAVMLGVILFVQVVHYPAFLQIEAERFPEFEKSHQLRTSLVVLPAMLIEAFSGLSLFLLHGGRFHSLEFAASLLLLGVCWFSTFLVQVPIHSKLEAGFDEALIQKLVRTNWIRTAGWSLRFILLLLLVR